VKYTDKQIRELKSDPSLWQMVSARVPSLEQVGREWKGLCPLHSEKTSSFTIRTEDGILLFHCFGCGKNGNIIQLVQEVDGISFNEAVEKVASFVGWKEGKKNVEQTFSALKTNEKESLTFPLAKLSESEKALEGSSEGATWLAGRGIDLQTAKRLHLGYVQSAKAINPHHPWVNDGWIVFPTIEGGTITSLKYRSVRGKKTETGEPGFLRKAGMATSLFNLQAITPFDDVFIVEGEPDALVMAQAGYTAVSLPSAAYNLQPAERDRLMTANRVFLAGDADNAGQLAMTKLWTELRERTYKMEWPAGMKDANQTFLEVCKGDVAEFSSLCEQLKSKALEQPMPFMFDLRESFFRSDSTKPMDNLARLRFPWASIDSWTAILPGDVMVVSATETGQGKTSWVMNVCLENAIKYGKCVVNYTAEVLPPQYARRAAAYLLNKPKDELGAEDFALAAERLKDARFYNGYKPGANYKDVIELLTWAKRRLGADILVVDHLHFLVRGERDEVKSLAESMRMLKDLALDFNVILIVVGQPRKPLANHRGREAVTQDLKGSEAFGSDASQVFILHRDRKSNGDDENMPIFDSVCKVKLDKSRESEPRATKLFFDGARCTFGMLERNYNEYVE
jgi:CHC2 zinc finger/DnaB-like helicase C terminal domain/Toprim-like